MVRACYRTRELRELEYNTNNISEYFKDFKEHKDKLEVYLVKQLPPVATQHPNILGLNIKYTIPLGETKFMLENYYVNDLPKELNYEILDYLRDTYLHIDIKIRYGVDYPFKPPTYEYVGIRTNINKKSYVEQYIQKRVNYHNVCYRKNFNWSPVVSIKGDVILFMLNLGNIANFINKI